MNIIKYIPFISSPATIPDLQQDTVAILSRGVITGIACGILVQAALRPSKHLTLSVFALSCLLMTRFESWRALGAIQQLALDQFFNPSVPVPTHYFMGHSEITYMLEKRLENPAILSQHALRVWEHICQCRFVGGRNMGITALVQKFFLTSSQNIRYQGLLIAVQSNVPTDLLTVIPDVKVDDFLQLGVVSQEIIDSIDLKTFDKICHYANPQKGGYDGLFYFACKFDNLSNNALTFFNSLMKHFPEIDNTACLKTCDEQNKPHVAAAIRTVMLSKALDQFIKDKHPPFNFVEICDQATFNELCKRPEVRTEEKAETLWRLVCKFNHVSHQEGSLFRWLIAYHAENNLTNDVFAEVTVGSRCPAVVDAICPSTTLDAYKKAICWSRLRDVKTGEVLQKHGYDINEDPRLIENVMTWTEDYTPDQGFSQTDNLKILLGLGRVIGIGKAILLYQKLREEHQPAVELLRQHLQNLGISPECDAGADTFVLTEKPVYPYEGMFKAISWKIKKLSPKILSQQAASTLLNLAFQICDLEIVDQFCARCEHHVDKISLFKSALSFRSPKLTLHLLEKKFITPATCLPGDCRDLWFAASDKESCELIQKYGFFPEEGGEELLVDVMTRESKYYDSEAKRIECLKVLLHAGVVKNLNTLTKVCENLQGKASLSIDVVKTYISELVSN